MEKEQLLEFKNSDIDSLNFDSGEVIPFYKVLAQDSNKIVCVTKILESKNMNGDEPISYFYLGYSFHSYLNDEYLSDVEIFKKIDPKYRGKLINRKINSSSDGNLD